MGRRAAPYITRLVTNYRCHNDILSLSERLFYDLTLKSVVPAESTHPNAPYPLVFVCSDITKPLPSENPINELEARIIIEQLQKYAPGWPQDRWGSKVDPSQICLMSSSRSQVRMLLYVFSALCKVCFLISRQIRSKRPSSTRKPRSQTY